MNISKQPNISSLKNKVEIKDLLATGRKVFNKYGIIFVLKKTNEPNLKSAILIKKKIGNAVHRNYIKRLNRHFIREHADQLSQYPRSLFLFLYKGKVTYQELASEYLRALKKYEAHTSTDN